MQLNVIEVVVPLCFKSKDGWAATVRQPAGGIKRTTDAVEKTCSDKIGHSGKNWKAVLGQLHSLPHFGDFHFHFTWPPHFRQEEGCVKG